MNCLILSKMVFAQSQNKKRGQIMSIYEQIKSFFYCLLAGASCGAFGLLFGFYDYAGLVYYDLRGGLFMFLCLFLAGFCACLWETIKQINNDEQ